jgi:hypothetical protein
LVWEENLHDKVPVFDNGICDDYGTNPLPLLEMEPKGLLYAIIMVNGSQLTVKKITITLQITDR